ncbi:hypothetical protein I551_7995 [Mycobacterium ulcerans str. Harvey]|uniref:Uncharacterized protein n=1 Tax=Mycobacterium ulcerans str. Harvey TaxID=1299332 RepID=A0ABP3A1P4_MYCUL|nr:hypothetical protein I551_7995 [Mycobacterium ulcerans str. Harvey]
MMLLFSTSSPLDVVSGDGDQGNGSFPTASLINLLPVGQRGRGGW